MIGHNERDNMCAIGAKKMYLIAIRDWCKRELGMKRTNFYHTFLPEVCCGQEKYIIDNCTFKAKTLLQQFNEGELDILFKEQLDDFVMRMIRINHRISFVNLLCCTLIETNTNMATRLSNFFRANIIEHHNCFISHEALSKMLFEYFIYALRGEMPKMAMVEEYYDYANDRNQFMVRVIERYGANSANGHTEIYQLIKEGNIFATFEAADIEYYGHNGIAKIDYQKAYDYYFLSIKVKKFHPVALFAVAYMNYYYQDPLSELCEANITQLDNLSVDERCEDALHYLRLACLWEQDRAYNLLGLMYQEDKMTQELRLRSFSDVENAEYFFKKAMNLGCKYAYINYAELALKLVERNLGHWSKVKLLRYYNIYITTMKTVADMGDTESRYHVGMMYFEGKEFLGETFVKKDLEKAYDYLKLASRYSSLYGMHFRKSTYMLFTAYYLNPQSSHYLEVSAEEMTTDIIKIIQATTSDESTEHWRSLLYRLQSDCDEVFSQSQIIHKNKITLT